jgi:S1-C subfamily serine protease
METLTEATNLLESLSNDLTQVIESVSRSVVAVNARRHLSSSGVYWRDGIVVTAAHTIRRAEAISVIVSGGATMTAALAGVDPSTDVAVLKIDSEDLAVANPGDPRDLRVGQLVVAVGRGALRGLNAALGVIGVLSASWRTLRGGLIDQFIGLDLVLHSGAAGGPLIDAHGRVLGINTPALSRNIALTIPSSTIDRIVTRLLEKGHLDRGYLGLGMQPIPIPEQLKRSLNLPSDSGLIVVTVDLDGPGARAGVLFGDIIVSLEGTTVVSIRDLQPFLEPESVGKPVAVSIIRGGQLVELNVTVGERKQRDR